MLLVAAVFAAFPELRNWQLIGAAAGLGLVLTFVGNGRVYRPAVTRSGDTITCRYSPWREATFYLALLGLPLIGFTAIAWGAMANRGSPVLWWVIGLLTIAATPIPCFVFFRHSRRSLLLISPSSLGVPTPGQQQVFAEIPRELVQSITPTMGRLGNAGTAPITQILYRTADFSSEVSRTVLIGPTNTKRTAWLTVEQSDLLAGLQAWKDGDPDDPGLMDRVEQILCGKVPNSV